VEAVEHPFPIFAASSIINAVEDTYLGCMHAGRLAKALILTIIGNTLTKLWAGSVAVV